MKKYLLTLTALTLLITPSVFASNTNLGVDLFIYNNAAQTSESGTVVLKLCDRENGGTCYCTTATDTLDSGSVSTTLDCSASDIANLPNTSFMQIELDGNLIASPEIQAVPYSLFSARSAEAETLAPGDVTINGNLIVTGSVSSSTPAGSGITGVIAGTGLIGGGNSGSVTLSSVLGTSIDTSEITDHAVTLGTKTTGNYVAALSAGSGINLSGISGAGSSHTISVNTGTSPLNIVQLDNSARLPAVNGSLLTNISIPLNSVFTSSIVDHTISTSDIAFNTLDFSNFSDSMTLDNPTTINFNNHDLNFHLNNTGRLLVTNGVAAATVLNVDASNRTITINNTDNVNIVGGNLSVGGTITSNCPAGFTNSGNYCIETIERSPDTLYNALSTCHSIGAQLCSAGQWISACFAGSGTAMSDNIEWVDDYTGQNDTVPPNIGYATFVLMGNGDCYTLGFQHVLDTAAFRCCSNK